MLLEIDSQLYLEPIEMYHADAYQALIISNADKLRQYFNWVDSFIKDNLAEDFIQKSQQKINRLEGITWVIKYQDRLVGSITLYDWMHDINKMSLGFWLDTTLHGQKIMTRCMQRVMDYAFNDIQVNKLEMYFLTTNATSLRLAEKFNFKIEGLHRQTYFLNGILHDQYMAGLLRHEWQT